MQTQAGRGHGRRMQKSSVFSVGKEVSLAERQNGKTKAENQQEKSCTRV
jgi:hypothetical protein